MGVSNGEIHPRNNKLPRVTVCLLSAVPLLILIILSILSNYPLYFFKNAVVDSLINICYNMIKQGTYAKFSERSNNNGNEYWK